MKRLHLVISGDVQGVGFRAWTVYFVKKNIPGVAGWVRNKEDGTVEVVAEGEKNDLDTLLQACKKGPEVSDVEHTQEEWLEGTGEFVRFEIKR